MHSAPWIRVYFALVLECNACVLESVYWNFPWNKEPIIAAWKTADPNTQILACTWEHVVGSDDEAIPAMKFSLRNNSGSRIIYFYPGRWRAYIFAFQQMSKV